MRRRIPLAVAEQGPQPVNRTEATLCQVSSTEVRTRPRSVSLLGSRFSKQTGISVMAPLRLHSLVDVTYRLCPVCVGSPCCADSLRGRSLGSGCSGSQARMSRLDPSSSDGNRSREGRFVRRFTVLPIKSLYHCCAQEQRARVRFGSPHTLAVGIAGSFSLTTEVLISSFAALSPEKGVCSQTLVSVLSLKGVPR